MFKATFNEFPVSFTQCSVTQLIVDIVQNVGA